MSLIESVVLPLAERLSSRGGTLPGISEEQLEVTSAAESAAGEGSWPLFLASVEEEEEEEEALATLEAGGGGGVVLLPSWLALLADALPSSGGDLDETDRATQTAPAGGREKKRKKRKICKT